MLMASSEIRLREGLVGAEMNTIAVIGSANVDLMVQVPRRPTGGETLLGSNVVVGPGGKGANQAVATSLIGGAVRFIGCVGNDTNGELLRNSMLKAGVDLSGLATTALPTGCAMILVTPDGENSIVVSPGANNAVTTDYLHQTEPLWTEASLVVLQLEVPMQSVEHVARVSNEKGIRFLLNAAPAATPPEHVLAICDPLVVNTSEAALILGAGGRSNGSPRDLAEGLLALGPRSVVVTLGASGALGLDRSGTVIHQPAPEVPAVDTTGAGDAFVGGLSHALAAGGTLSAGLALGAKVAAIAVQRAGAQSSYPAAGDLG